MDHFRNREGTLAPLRSTFPTEEMKMNQMADYYNEFAARQAEMLKTQWQGEVQETTVMRGNYQHIRAYE